MTVCKSNKPSYQLGDRIWLIANNNQPPLPGRLVRFMGYRPPLDGYPAATLWGVECYNETIDECRTIRFATPKPSYRLARRYLPYTPQEKEIGVVQ